MPMGIKRAAQPYTVRAREMGAELIEHREAAGMSLRAVSRKLGWSAPHVSQIETGGRPPSPADVSAYLAACGPHRRAEYHRLVALAAEPDTRYLVRSHGPELPSELRSLIVQESIANDIMEFEPTVVPGLLQSEGYVRELLKWGGMLKPEALELRVQARLARQGLLHRAQPPKCVFFVQERALRTVIGDARVMNEQLVYLMLTGELRHCSIRVVLDSAGPFGALSGGFRVMDYARFPALVYTEGLTASTFMDGPADVVDHRRLLSKLDKAALNEGESRAWLADLAAAYDRAEAAPSCQLPTGLD
jgi:transcriptional regulator with XRE-family HTH domain